MDIQYIQPGKPNQNAYIERFKRTFGEERSWTSTCSPALDDVREATYRWMLEYKEERPHESLGNLTPSECRHQRAGGSTFELCA